jgi:hypothetical protein
MTQANYYEIIGVPRQASPEQINKAFREKALLLHPDKNTADPEAAKKFKALAQAYQVLMDPVRRAKFDLTLPLEILTSTGPITDLAFLWQSAEKIFFDQSERFTPAVDAMRLSRPITLEDDALLIVGIDPAKGNLIGYLTTTMTHNHVRNILGELYGKSLDFRLISGMTLEDWQALKEGEDKVTQRRIAAEGRSNELFTRASGAEGQAAIATSLSPETVWEETLECFSRQWSACESRMYPQSRARYLLEQVPLLARAEDIARAGGSADEQIQRLLARAMERLASISGIDSGAVALEYLRYRARLLGGML